MEDLANLTRDRDADPYAPLHLASINGDLKTVRVLVEQGHAQVDVLSGHGMTPVNLAARERHLKVLKYLILQGHANPNLPNRDNQTPVCMAASNDDLQALQLLVKKSNASVTHKSLVIAARGDNVNVLQWLLDEWILGPVYNGNKVELLDSIFASYSRGYLPTARLLLEGGANPLAKKIDTHCYGSEFYRFVYTFHKFVFLSGFHSRLGIHSSILLYFEGSSIYEPALISDILELCSFGVPIHIRDYSFDEEPCFKNF